MESGQGAWEPPHETPDWEAKVPPSWLLGYLVLSRHRINACSRGHWLTKPLLPCSFPFPEEQGPEIYPCPSIQQVFLSSSYLGFSNSLLKQLGFLFSLGTRLFLSWSHKEVEIHYLILFYSAIQTLPQMEAPRATLSLSAMASKLDTLNKTHVKVKAGRFSSFSFLSPFFL